MAEKINIRVAIVNDAIIIDKITNDSWNKTYKGFLSKQFLDNLYFSSKKSVEIIKKHINQFYVIERNNVVLGFVRIKEINDSVANINSLYMDINEINKGYGTMLINYIFKNLKYNKYIIEVFNENSANVFYKKIGAMYVRSEYVVMDNKKHLINIYEYKVKDC